MLPPPSEPRAAGASLRARVALLMLSVCVIAFGIAYLGVASQLVSALERQRLDELKRSLARSVPRLADTFASRASPASASRLRELAEALEVRAYAFRVRATGGGDFHLAPLAGGEPWPAVRKTARSAAAGGSVARVSGRGRARTAVVARPLPARGRDKVVVVFARSLGDVQRTAKLLRERGAIALLLALAFVLVGAIAVSQAVIGRVRAVERAARAIARGQHPGPVPVERDDELGALARAFNEMQERLAQAERARRDFIVTASHELRTPLSSLGGFVELLRDEELDTATRRRFLATMADQVERLQRLAVDLLDLSRIDSGDLELAPESSDLSELVTSVAREFEAVASERGHRLELRVNPSVQAFCDPDRAAQIVRVLIDNALRHTPKGTRVRVSCGRRRSDGRPYVRVIDNGPGIPEELRARIFEPFVRGNESPGAGLGLAIARQLAERMGGSLSVRSSGGETCLELTLPADRAPRSSADTDEPSLTASPQRPMGT